MGTVRKVRVRIPPASPAWFAPLTEFSDGSVAFGDFDFPECEPQAEDEKYRVESRDTLVSIAN